MKLPFKFGKKPKEPFEIPAFYSKVRDYVLFVLDENEQDADLEVQPLGQNGFNLLHLAFVFVHVAKRYEVSIDQVELFWRIGVGPNGGDPELANLILRCHTLLEAFSESDAMLLLHKGAVGDPSEIRPIRKEFDNVSFVVKGARCVKTLKEKPIPV